MEPLLHDFIAEKVGNREKGHTLMMGHPTSHQLAVLTPSAGSGEIRRFVESVSAEPAIVCHPAQVLQRRLGGGTESQKS